MRKILSFMLVLLFISSTSFGQLTYRKDFKPSASKENAVKSVNSDIATLTYSTEANGADIGYNGTQELTAVAYFPEGTMSSYNGDMITKLLIGVDPGKLTGDLVIKVWTDTSNVGANPEVTTSIPVADLNEGWNEITFTTPYNIDGSAVFVGYTVTSTSYGLYMDDGTAQADGYGDLLCDGNSWAHAKDYNIDHNFHIKAIVGQLDAIDAKLLSINTPSTVIASSVDITGTVKNNGSDDLTSFDVTYTIDGGLASATYSVTGLSIAYGSTTDFTHNVQADLSTAKAYSIEVTISNINSDIDADESNNKLSKVITSASEEVQKKILHEVLTASTCPPCADANPVLDGVVYKHNEDKATLIKYQVSWPAPGDPYANAESQAKVDFYGVSSVPTFKVDGTNDEDGVSYTQAKLDNYANGALSLFKISGTANYVGTTMTVSLDLDAVSGVSGDLVAYVAVIEEKTTGNIGTNGETEFNNVMMKFMPAVSGSNLTDFNTGDNQHLDLSKDLTGTNIEWVGNLRIVAWIQDKTTKEVYQSEYITVTSTEADAGATKVNTVNSACGLPTDNNISIDVYNGGNIDLADVDVSYTVNGSGGQTETVSNLAIGEKKTITFPNTEDFSTEGTTYNIIAKTAISGDNWSPNDDANKAVSNVEVSTIPYTENFTNATVGWSVEDANSDGSMWTYKNESGIGNGDNTAYTYFAYPGPPEDNLYSTCIDLEAGTDYKLSFFYHTQYGTYTLSSDFKVSIGNAQTNSAMNQDIVTLAGASKASYTESKTVFTVPTTGTYYLQFNTNNGYTLTIDDVSIDKVVGIENINNSNFSIYPNPTTGLVKVDGVEGAQIIVYNIIGEALYTNTNASATTTIDLSSFNAGNYIVKVINNNQVSTQKIILTK